MTSNKTYTQKQALNHSQALRLIQQTAQTREVLPETITVSSALNRIAAVDIAAPFDLPTHACSSMDGYAINLSQLQTQVQSTNHEPISQEYRLHLGEPVHAAAQKKPVTCDQLAIPIMTGGLLPKDADAVVLKEHARRVDDEIFFDQLPKKNEYIRAPGSDLQEGQPVIKAHKALSPSCLGLLSSLGMDRVKVKKKTQVALMMSGDELVTPGQPCQAGQIYDANSVMLANLLEEMGCEVHVLPTLVDTEATVKQRLQELSEAEYDLVITVGGVSMGDKDWIPVALSEHGKVVFHKLRIKPGFPMLFGELGSALFFGLPGNPVSSYTTACQYVYPAVQCLNGQTPLLDCWRATLVHDIKKSHLRREYMRGLFSMDHEGQLNVAVCGGQQSSRIESLSQANCFIVLNESEQDLTAGSRVLIQPFTTFTGV